MAVSTVARTFKTVFHCPVAGMNSKVLSLEKTKEWLVAKVVAETVSATANGKGYKMAPPTALQDTTARTATSKKKK